MSLRTMRPALALPWELPWLTTLTVADQSSSAPAGRYSELYSSAAFHMFAPPEVMTKEPSSPRENSPRALVNWLKSPKGSPTVTGTIRDVVETPLSLVATAVSWYTDSSVTSHVTL